MTEMLSYNDPHSPLNSPKRKLERFLIRLGKKKTLNLALLSFAALMLPIALIAVQQQTSLKQHASSTQVVFVDTNNTPITQTTTANVRVKLTSPYSVTGTGMNQDMNNEKIAIGETELDYKTVLGTSTATYQVNSSTDDLNEINGLLDPSYPSNYQSVWLGTGPSTTASYTGLRFTNITIPKGASVTSARLAVNAVDNAWINMKFQIAAHATGNSPTFSSLSRPSQRQLTATKINHSSNTRWSANNWYALNEINTVIQEIVNRSDWQAGNSISIILKGTGKANARKFVKSFDAGAATAPKLLVTYSIPDTITPTLQPTSAPTMTSVPPTATATPSSTPATTTSIVLAEDPNFMTNPKTISPVTANPIYADYTFSNAIAGEKLLFAKFISSTGESQIFSSSITLTQIATSPTTPPTSGGTNSMAMGKWNPNPKFDTCTKEQHDAYKVQGPDGKWYPTWHPPVDPATGCKFGHEHGRDPKQSLIWDQVRTHFAYDENKNGSIDSTELAAAGLPFGYVNEQLDAYNSGLMMRHEDHVGHKVEYANGETDIATDQFDTNPTGGVVVPIKTASGTPKWNDSGIRCYHFAKIHQGVSSPDAFTNNLHELFYFTDCKSSNSAYNSKASTTVLVGFGKPGEFTNLCDGAGDRTSIVSLGTTSTNQNYPVGESGSARNIIQRNCIEQYYLVPEGRFSMNMYEAWPGGFRIQTPEGRTILTNGNLFDVEDANRYFYPEDLKVKNGYNNPEAKTNLGFSMDLCYEVEANGDKARNNMCDAATNYGTIKGITWDSPKSAFRGLHRGMYFNPPSIQNADGPEYWYTDPFGGNAQKTPFPGSVKQYQSAVNVGYSALGQTDPRVNDRQHNDGGGTVHAPN